MPFFGRAKIRPIFRAPVTGTTLQPAWVGRPNLRRITRQVSAHMCSSAGATIAGNIINNAAIVIDANSSLNLEGSRSATAPVPFINRSTITLPASRTLSLANPFTNEGQIVVSGGTLNIDAESLGGSLFKNTGANGINLAHNPRDLRVNHASKGAGAVDRKKLGQPVRMWV